MYCRLVSKRFRSTCNLAGYGLHSKCLFVLPDRFEQQNPTCIWTMVTCQLLHPVKEDTRCVTVEQSLQLTRNLMRIAIFNITYIRGLFPEKYFVDKFVPALEMYIKKLLPLDNESRRLIDWMEKGVYDALYKKYLKTLVLRVCNAEESSLIEEYSFSFSYSVDSSKDISMNITRNGDGRRGKTFITSTPEDVNPTQMKNSACKLVRTLVALMRTLDHIPAERTILMKLFYFDDVTPPDYEPPFFRACSHEEKLYWSRTPLKLKVGNVDSKYFAMSLKVKSILDPCQGDNEQMGDADGPLQDSESSASEADQQSDLNTLLVETNTGNKEEGNEACTMEEDTHDPHTGDSNVPFQIPSALPDDGSLELIKTWVLSRELNEFDTFDVLQSFPDILTIQIEEILCRLVKQHVITFTGKDRYVVHTEGIGNKAGDLSTEAQLKASGKESYTQRMTKTELKGTQTREDETSNLYLQALSHVLPLEYITTAQLHHKLGRPPIPTIRKLMERMANEGLIEKVSSNKRLGKRVLHSKRTETKLQEVRQTLNVQTEVLQALEVCSIARDEPPGDVHADAQVKGSNYEPAKSARQAVPGSDVSQQVLIKPDHVVKGLAGSKRPSSPARSGTISKHTVSGQSALGYKSAIPYRENAIPGAFRNSQNSSEDGFRKASRVKDPIVQQAKRFRSEP